MNFLTCLIQLALPAVLIWGLFHALRFRFRGKALRYHLNKTDILYVSLLSWIVIGWIGNWDHNKDWGCFPVSSPHADQVQNFLFSGISILIIMCAYFIPNRRLSFTLLSLELGLWLGKLLFMKGGYAVGIGGAADFPTLIYDTIALVLRLLFIRAVSRMLVYPKTILLSTLLVIFLKLWIFR
ncbi:MAG TPA: hypothetical protein DCG19_00815 [Cryomorphaceae bacterium]|nr:hypothetical protein [Owenweeksia sp.]MBF99089.1 hypothetical protein [Owenweeksia sp.]HAD95910.1 hypothetical protein [Cryomorphaceae bacterium]HBF21585.1 hypothetical protein [Cryomorphaceae bacterium]HCQ16062.1 hypothetical protein [Cryomorphaceae bacterium]|tara:strand:+ start:538 stop:1083 length:546 start_codon:yes stop_codon:yes gene_type:complete